MNGRTVVQRGVMRLRWLGLAGLLAAGVPLATPLAAHAESMSGDLVSGTTTFTQSCDNSTIYGTWADCIQVITITTVPGVPSVPPLCTLLPCGVGYAPSNAQWWNVDIGEDRYSGCKGGGYSENPNGCSTHDYHVEEKSSDWYTSGASGNNWVDGSNCVGYGPWACTSKSWGSFWDSQYGRSTDWSDWVLQVNMGTYHDQNNEYARFWLYPGGRYEVYVGS